MDSLRVMRITSVMQQLPTLSTTMGGFSNTPLSVPQDSTRFNLFDPTVVSSIVNGPMNAALASVLPTTPTQRNDTSLPYVTQMLRNACNACYQACLQPMTTVARNSCVSGIIFFFTFIFW